MVWHKFPTKWKIIQPFFCHSAMVMKTFISFSLLQIGSLDVYLVSGFLIWLYTGPCLKLFFFLSSQEIRISLMTHSKKKSSIMVPMFTYKMNPFEYPNYKNSMDNFKIFQVFFCVYYDSQRPYKRNYQTSFWKVAILFKQYHLSIYCSHHVDKYITILNLH